MSITKPKYHINRFFCNHIKDYDYYLSFLTSSYEQKAIVLFQNNNLRNHASNCEIFCKNILHAKYVAKYSKPDLFTYFLFIYLFIYLLLTTPGCCPVYNETQLCADKYNSFMTEIPIIQKPNLLCKSMDWFLYDKDLCYKRVNINHLQYKTFST